MLSRRFISWEVNIRADALERDSESRSESCLDVTLTTKGPESLSPMRPIGTQVLHAPRNYNPARAAVKRES